MVEARFIEGQQKVEVVGDKKEKLKAWECSEERNKGQWVTL